MNSSFVLCAYFAMVLSPCFVATYGDLLSVYWLFALARRRRAHRAESLLASVYHVRYAMAVAREAAFALASSEYLAPPKPFLVPKRSAPVETPAFLEARQRVAARVAQLAVANKLRSAAEAAEKVVTLPADVPAVGDPASLHIRPRKALAAPVLVPASIAAQPVLAEAAHLPTHLVFRRPTSPPPGKLDAVATASPRTAPRPEAVPPLRKPGESGAVEIAA